MNLSFLSIVMFLVKRLFLKMVRLESLLIRKKLMKLNAIIEPCVVPLNDWNGFLLTPHGTGSLVKNGKNCYLITNYHVCVDDFGTQSRLLMKYNKQDIQLNCSIVAKNKPNDVAIDNVDSLSNNISSFISSSKLRDSFSPQESEIFYIVGYPSGLTDFKTNPSNFTSKALKIHGFEIPIDMINPTLSKTAFALECPGLYEKSGKDIEGLSGALVWNTKIIECLMKGETWSPDKAVVAGIVRQWGGHTPASVFRDTLICTKIEQMFIPDLIAYWNMNKSSIQPNSFVTI